MGLAALRRRPFRVFWTGQLLAAVGISMQSVSLPWLVLALGGSAVDVGLVVALQYVPVFVLAPLSGVVADRLDKRRLLLGLHATSMAISTVLFVLAAGEGLAHGHLLVLAALLGIVNALEMPVRQSFLAELVPGREIRSAIALTMTGFNAARMVGPALAGVVIATVGVWANFGINAITALAVLAALATMGRTVAMPSVAVASAGVRESLREGMAYARRTPSVRWPLLLLGGVATLGMNFQVLLPLLARDRLGLGGEGYGLLFAALGLGSLIGSVAVTLVRPASWLPLMLRGGAVFLGFELLLGLAPTLLIATPLVVGMGACAMLMVTAINLTIQERVAHRLRGRVMSLYVTVFAGSVPTGGLLAGIVADAWGASAALIVGALTSAVVLALVARRLVADG